MARRKGIGWALVVAGCSAPPEKPPLPPPPLPVEQPPAPAPTYEWASCSAAALRRAAAIEEGLGPQHPEMASIEAKLATCPRPVAIERETCIGLLAEREELLTRYGSMHPAMRANKAKLALCADTIAQGARRTPVIRLDDADPDPSFSALDADLGRLLDALRTCEVTTGLSEDVIVRAGPTLTHFELLGRDPDPAHAAARSCIAQVTSGLRFTTKRPSRVKLHVGWE